MTPEEFFNNLAEACPSRVWVDCALPQDHIAEKEKGCSLINCPIFHWVWAMYGEKS